MKPILFNTEMVKALLDGRKTVTRRLVKPKYSNTHFEFKHDKYGTTFIELQNDIEGETHGKNEDGSTWHKLLGYIEPKAPYKVGDILYVREIFCPNYFDDCIATLRDGNKNAYKADYNKCIIGDVVPEPKWKPSIHMPKEAARIFLRVTGVRAERLQDIDKNWDNYDKEGMRNPEIENISIAMQERFISIWNSTISKKDPSDMYKYGWKSNPWVWVIEFERVSKEVAYAERI